MRAVDAVEGQAAPTPATKVVASPSGRPRLYEIGAYVSYLALAVPVLIQIWISPN